MTADNIYLLNFKPEGKSEANIVLTPRQAILSFSDSAKHIKEILRKACIEKDIEIISGKMTANYLHLLIAFPKNLAVKEVVEHIKKSSSEKILVSSSSVAGGKFESFWDEEYMAIMSENSLSDIFLNDTINNYIQHIERKRGTVDNQLKSGEACKNAKVLVTGGAGFIGSNLVDELLRKNNEVVVIDNLSTGKIEYVNPQAKFYKIDINSEKINDIFAREKFDFVFHLAAQMDVRKSVLDPVEDNKVNVLGSLNILEACKKNEVKKIIFVSTGGAIYGDTEKIPTLEDHSEMPLSPYGIHKLTFEKYLNYYHKVYGVNYLTLRLANVYGPRQYKGGEAGVVSIFIDNAVNGKKSTINGDGSKTRDYVYVGDVISSMVSAMNTDYIGWINIGTGIETSISQIVTAIEEAMGGPIHKEHGEDKPGEQKRSSLDNRRAKEILGWEPKVAFNDGVRKTIEWSKKAVSGGSL